ncbi:hypothetical protein SASPL_133745 [Salvia splendens]|uniref:Leucine-rich PPR motif-containing protein, mitochondrial n=1 Tax=Salvia splendens TaxID=180675 RepID=A0A8X8X3A0_SALSN|nr:hypothetical protein SASPL_133745 [Salvia splendens]
MLVKRLVFRLKCTNNSFREWKAFDTIGKKEDGFVQGGRFFGTSNDGEEVINALHSGQRSRASNLLSELGSGDRASEVHSFLPILQFCARAPDPLFAMETWKLMVEKDVKLSEKCYLFTIKALCKGDYLDEQEGMLKDIITYSQLLKLAVLQQNLSAVHEIWKDCIKYYSLSIITLRKFVWAFTRLKDLESAYMALQKMVAAASQHKFSTTATYEQMLCISRLDVPIPFSDDLARDRYTRSSDTSVSYSPVYNKENDSTKGARFGMQETGVAHAGISLSEQPFSGPVMKLLMCSFDDIISSCAHSRNIMFAEQLMLQMRVLGLEPSSRTYNGYIRALVSVKTFHDGVEVLNIMRQKNMKPSDSTLAALSVSCSRGLQLDLAETFLDQVSKCNHVNIFNEFLKACDTVYPDEDFLFLGCQNLVSAYTWPIMLQDKPERAIRVWARMKYKNLKPDIRTYELLFSLFGSVNAPYDDPNLVSQADAAKRIKAIEMDMTRHGIQHNLFSLQNLLKALGREKMVNELIQYIRVAEEQCVYRNTNLGVQIYNTFLHSLVEAKESHMAIEIFKKMILCGLLPNLSTYGIMIDCCSIINCYTSACALISRMIRDGLPMNVVIYTGLVKILSRSEAFNEAFRLLDLAISEAIQPDLLLYDAILKIASQKGKIGVLELIVEKMHRLKIRPDPSTCRHVFSAYADNGFHSTAMEALQVMSLRMISEEDDILEEYKLKYENLILDEESDAESEIVGVFKDLPDLVVSLLNLRWYAILVSPPSWLPDQSPWAKRLSSNYTARLSG